MNIIYLAITVLLLFIPIIVIIIAFFFVWHLIITRRAPFVPIPKAVLGEIVKALELRPNSVLFDLGCGDGRVLLAAQAGQPKAKFVGIDVSWLPITLARWRIRLGKARNIKLTHGSFFKQDLTPATHVFTYLFPEIMNQLLPKLKQELHPGTRLVSCDFQFNELTPQRIINLNRPHKALGQRLFVYEF